MTEKQLLRATVPQNALNFEAEGRLRAFLYSTRLWQAAPNIFIYVSVPPEPDTREIILRALKEGKTVAVPRIYPGRHMQAHIISSLEELVTGRYGIPEPPKTSPVLEKPALAIIPCTACDKRLNRLGRGAGYYDRYLASHACPALCLCREEAVLNRVPSDETDIKPLAMISEKRIYTEIPDNFSEIL